MSEPASSRTGAASTVAADAVAADAASDSGPPDDGSLEEGLVKWYSRARGYGFLLRGDGSEIFVHHSSLVDRSYRVLDDGERVRFRVADGDRGLKAVAVERLAAAAAEKR